MNAATIIALIALCAAVFFALWYIFRAKRRGDKCIGCPYAGSCGGSSQSGSGGKHTCP